MKTKQNERRKHPRIDTCISFNISADGADIAAETINLSCNGAYCRVSRYIPMMTGMQISFTLPADNEKEEAECISCYGVVVRVEKSHPEISKENVWNIAVFFTDIEESQKKKISDYVEELENSRSDE